MSQEKRPLGKILLEQKALSVRDLDSALELQRREGGHLASRLTDGGIIREAEALKALSEQHGVPGIDLNQVCIALSDLELLPREIAERHKILPVLVRDDRIFVAMANPGEKKVIDELEFVTGKRVFPYVALDSALERVLEHAYQLKMQGERFFVGPTCPPETLQRMGADPSLVPSAPPAPTARTDTRPPVVTNDSMGRAAAADDLTDDGFGTLSADISQITNVEALTADSFGDDLGLGPKKTILVVDDEAEIRRMLKRLLEDKGYRVLEADRGLAALRMVKESTPDLIILDAMLPEVHGFDIARRIKGSQKYGHIPIVMISAVYRGWRYAEDIKSSYGVAAYIEKPFRIGGIVAAVEKAFTAEPAAPDTPEEEAAVSADAERALAEGIAAYHAGDVDKAIASLKRGVGIDPLAYRLHFHLGLLLGKRGLIYEAIQALETALDINSRHFPALKNLAVLYQKAGFRNKAIETWERALSMAPDEPTKQSIKEHLVGLL